MKLHEIKGRKGGSASKKVTIEPAKGVYGEVTFDVEYKVSPGGSSRHGDDASFDEDHDDEYTVVSAKTTHKVEQLDDDGHDVVKVWPKGTNAEDLPGWTSKDDRALEEKL